MTAKVARVPRGLQFVTVAELMRDQEEALDTVHWQWTGMGRDAPDDARWAAFELDVRFTVGQLRHVLFCAFREADQRRPSRPPGLEFRVVTASGRRAVISSDDDVKIVLRACSPNGNPLKNARRLLDAMRLQSEHQVGLDAAML